MAEGKIISLIAALLSWRALLLLVAAITVSFTPALKFSFPYIEQLMATDLPQWIWTAANFDGVHYLSIAETWYGAYFTQAFFPLYPLLIRVLAWPFGTPSLGLLLLLGLFISNVALFISLFLFWWLARRDFPSSIAAWSIVFLLTFPTSFFFGMVYSESLFLLLTLAAFFFARKKQWFWSAVVIGLASGTRVIGILLLPAIFYEYLRDLPKTTGILLKSLRFFWIAPLGLVSYIAYQWWTLGHPFFFLHSQTQFGVERLGGGIVLLPQVLWRYGKILSTVPLMQYDFWVSAWELGFSIFGFALLALGYRMGIRRSYLLFGVLALLLPTLSGTFSSMPRYLLAAFPIFLVLAHIRSKWVKTALVGVFFALQLFFLSLFTRGFWVA